MLILVGNHMLSLTKFKDCPIRYKLLTSYSMVFFLVITSGSYVINSFVRLAIEANIESELKNATYTISDMVKTSASVSIKNYFRAAAEKNKEILDYFHQRYLKGELTLEQAQKQAADILLNQKIGKSGYIFCATSDGFAAVHPDKEVEGKNFSTMPFVKEIVARKEGYIKYNWKNPGEEKARPKALYMSYFAPWDWTICVSSYQEEFIELVNVDDFKESILSLKFGKSGYSFVFDTNGRVVIHPREEVGRNFFGVEDKKSRQFIQEMMEKKDGKIIYAWKNPATGVLSNKLVIYKFIPEFNWIVGSSGCLEEIYEPLYTVRNIIILTVIVSLVLVTFLTFWFSSLITNPLSELMKQLDMGNEQNFKVRMKVRSKDEIGQLARYFNNFMKKLERYSNNVQKEVMVRKKKEKDLRFSEEMFSKAFRSSPNGIFIAALKDFRFINVNDGFLRYFSYRRDEIIGKTLFDLKLPLNKSFQIELTEKLKNHEGLHNQAIEYRTKFGEVRHGIISAEIVKLWDEPAIFATIEDITDRKQLEREVMEISETERQEIGQNLHDDICPHLIGTEVLSKILLTRMRKKGSEDAASLEKIRNLIVEAIAKTRSLARGLCPVHLTDNGLVSSLYELTQNINEIYSVTCVFNCNSPVPVHDNMVATHLFYIAQESIQNAIKHGSAEKISIDLKPDDKNIYLNIHDNGSGIEDTTLTKGMGLKIMKYRADMIGASIEIKSHPDNGTHVAVSLVQ